MLFVQHLEMYLFTSAVRDLSGLLSILTVASVALDSDYFPSIQQSQVSKFIARRVIYFPLESPPSAHLLLK